MFGRLIEQAFSIWSAQNVDGSTSSPLRGNDGRMKKTPNPLRGLGAEVSLSFT